MERPLVWQRAIHPQPGLVPSAAPIRSWLHHIKREYMERVESKPNLAHGPSHLDFSLIKQFLKLIRSMFPDFHRFFDVVC